MMKKKTGLLTDPIYMQHQTGMHPEKPERLAVTLKKLEAGKIWNQLEKIPASKADIRMVELVHDSNYIENLERQIKSGQSTVYSPDCMVSLETFDVALNAVGGAKTVVDSVLAGELVNGFCLVRPPGHHAERASAMGFCYFNNIAVCAEYLIRQKGFQRILIMDFDVHHGNGTQHFFEDRSDVFYCSIHESPMSCFPGTGSAGEKGVGAGSGYTLNVPMNAGSGDAEYEEALTNMFIPAWESYQPDFVLVSAGFDAHHLDPLANINITEDTYTSYTNALCRIAEEHCHGKLVGFLEGGYNLQEIPALIESHIANMVESANRM